MINIISNDCTSAYLYKEIIKGEYPNMFNPAWMSTDNFVTLISNYDKIDFRKIKVDKIIESKNGQNFENLLAYSRFKNDLCYVTIDGQVKIVYDRYIEDDELSFPNVNQINGKEYMCVPDLKLYVKERYFARLVRFLQNDEEPVFVFNEQPYTTPEEIQAFIDVKTPYNKILYTSNNDFLLCEADNLIIELVDDIDSESYINCAEFVDALMN